ncbi:MAG: polyprenyl synthetase family protein, partial [Balneolaceae bacterium]|nr:polyprenyl synthetase family protein [Balneolaceae bacterium]
RDDLFDYGVDDVGKPRRNDIKERKVTLPLIKALEKASYLKKARIRYLMRKRKKKDEEIEEIVSFVHENNGMEYARKVMEEYAGKAVEELSKLPQSEGLQDFKDLIEFIINRKK